MRDHKGIPKWLDEIRGEGKSYSFNIDHPYKLDGTKSFVFYPYHFDVKQVEPFRIYLESMGYELSIEHDSEYGGETFKVIIKHKDDLSEFFEKGFKRIQKECDTSRRFWKMQNERDLKKKAEEKSE